ncbi:hypothetical protein T552_04058 [Pneumocystis carinii B80]|uniref:Extracellular membrane protein CFEM domain-containing protein n=1 Tax=Pneumocystis carinii (strain B80) TaxID=1408658 RepID=A0A0W4ZT69_PNEC8|nr:hypothetical protein T552_04058 [Pneumocystis carinii B80]KTW31556.1 hypothetical protein T552_04058 [Pneumocystis carinii B80]
MQTNSMMKGFFIIIFLLIESFYCKPNTHVSGIGRQKTHGHRKITNCIEKLVIRFPQQKNVSVNSKKKCLDSLKANGSYLDSSWTQNKPFLVFQSLTGPYNLHLVHLADSMRICRDSVKNSVKASLSEQNNQGYSESLRKVDLHQKVKDNGLTQNKVLGRVNRRSLYSFLKTWPSESDNFKHKSNRLFGARNGYLGRGDSSLHKTGHKKRIIKRSFLSNRRSKVCNSVFEGSGINGKVVKCFENILRKIRCGNSFNAICICDSVEYLKRSQECLHGLSRQDGLKAREYHQKLCENPDPPPKECINEPEQEARIISCPKPYENIELDMTTYHCARNAIRNSLCTDFFDASCLCDSISYNNMLSRCISDSITSVSLIHTYHETLCKNPLSLSGCTAITVKDYTRPVKCDSMFKDFVPEGEILDCLKKKAFESRCNNDFNVPCICDSFYFASTAYTCFSSFFDQESQKIFDDIKSLCYESHFHKKCIGERDNTLMRRICPGFYEGYGLDEATKRCIVKLTRRSYCNDPLDIACLCDSLTFINGLVTCFASEPYNGNDKMMLFYEELCFNPYSYSGCKSSTALSVLNVDMMNKGFSIDNKTSMVTTSEKKVHTMDSNIHQPCTNKSQAILATNSIKKDESNESYHCKGLDDDTYVYVNQGNNLSMAKISIWSFIIIITTCINNL